MGNIARTARTPPSSSENPFGMAPSSGRFYGNAQYEEACNRILNGICERRGLIVVTGEPGTGKTTLVQQAIDRLNKSNCSVLFCSFHPALDETLNSLCQHLGLSIADQEQQQKIQQLNQALFVRFRNGESTAFVVDDAHNLDPRTVAQILSLANRTLTGEQLLQVVLVGLPELGAKLHSAVCRPSLPSAFPSIEVRALPPAEVAPFIEHQLRAGAAEPRRSFTPAAMQRIAAYSNGIPREINALCGLASVIANLESSLVVTEEMVEEIKGERALWGVGIEAQTAPSTAGTSKTQALPAPAMSWTSVHPAVYPPKTELEAVNDGDGGGTGERQDLDPSPTLVVDENVIPLGAASASPMATIRAEGRSMERGVAARRGWWPSWWLTGSALAFSAFVVASLVLWNQFPFSGDAARSNAPARAENRLAQDNPEAEIEFAQMRPVITGETPDPAPSPARNPSSPALSAIAPRSAADASIPAVEPPSKSESPPTHMNAGQTARSQAVAPTLAPDPMPSPSPTAKAFDIKTKQQQAIAKVDEKGSELSDQRGSQPIAAFSKPETAASTEQAPAAASFPAAEAVTEPTTGAADKSEKLEQNKADNTMSSVAHAKPGNSLPLAMPAEHASATTSKKPSASSVETTLPSILGAVDNSGYQSMENEVMDRVTAQMLPVDPKQIDLPGFRRFLSEDREPGAAAIMSGPAASTSALPLNPGSLPTFSGR